MVVLDADHPEILDFIRWKMREEKKVAALVAAGYSSDFNGEAYGTVSGQNSNNSVRLPDRFMQAVADDLPWQTTFRTTGEVYETLRAREIWRETRRRRLAVRRSRRAVRRHHPEVAHLQDDREASTPRTRAPSTCSWTTPPATWRR